MNNRFTTFVLALASAAVASAAPQISAVRIGGTDPSSASSPATFDAYAAPAVTATVSGAARAWVEFKQGAYVSGGEPAAMTDVMIPMTGSGTSWSATMPVIGAGAVSWSVVAEDDAGETAVSGEYSYTVTDDLGALRHPDFTVLTADSYWRTTPLGRKASGVMNNSKWRASYITCLVGTHSLELPPRVLGTNGKASNYSYMRSNEAFDGIGTIWFKARYPNGTNGFESATLDVQASTKIGTGYETVETVAVPAGEEWTQFRLVCNLDENLYLQFYNGNVFERTIVDGTSTPSSVDITEWENQNRIEISDIAITPIAPDVDAVADALDYTPGYPSISDPVSFRIHVTNKWDSAPVADVTARLVWRLNEGEWTETLMTNVLGWAETGDGTYVCTLPALDSGIFEYMYRVDFTGRAATFAYDPAIQTAIAGHKYSTGARNEASFAKWVRPDGLVNESRSPAYNRDFAANYQNGKHQAYYAYVSSGEDLSHLFDLKNLDSGDWPKAVNDGSYPVENSEDWESAPEGLAYEYKALRAADGVRRFRSLYDTMRVVPEDNLSGGASRLADAYDMQLVGDYTWQAVIYVTNAIDANLEIVSTAYWPEDEDAADYIHGAGSDLSAFHWGQVNQSDSEINPPMAATVVRSDAELGEEDVWAPVRVQIDYVGFLVFRFNTLTGDYQIRRAAWQDFNDWQADDAAYSRSFGLYGTTTYEVDSTLLQPTTFSEGYWPWFENIQAAPMRPSLSAMATESTYWGGLVARNAWFVEEQSTNTLLETGLLMRNKAIRLSTMPGRQGTLQTTRETGAYNGGAGRDTFRLRARASSDDDRIAVFADATVTNSYLVGAWVKNRGTVDAGNPAVSAIGYWKNSGSYFEARLSSIMTSAANNNNNVNLVPGRKLELIAFENGVETVLGATTNSTGGLSVNDYVTLKLTTSGSTVNAEARMYSGAKDSSLGSQIGSAITRNNYSTSVTGGLPGVNTRDTDSVIVPLVFDTTTTAMPGDQSRGEAYKTISLSDSPSWDLGVRESYGWVSPWTFGRATATGTADPNKLVTLQRKAPSAYFRVKVYRSGEAEAADFLAPVPYGGADWDEGWDEWKDHKAVPNSRLSDSVVKVSGFGWTEMAFPMHFWDDSYICVEALSGDGAGNVSGGSLVVDNLSCSAWHGQEVYDSNRDYGTDADVLASAPWRGHNAAIVQDGREGMKFELDLTRAPSTEEQYVETPLMIGNGVGDVTFRYRVETWPVAFQVGLVDESGASWTPLYATTNAAGVSESCYVPCLTNVSGRLRIQPLPYAENGTNRLGRMLIASLRATDYPNAGDSSWEAYNVLVSTFPKNRKLKFDGYSDLASSYRSAVLNDSYSRDTLNGIEFSDHQPNIQTPSIETGVGEISFWYRASPDNAGAPAKLSLQVARATTTPDENWVTLTKDDLSKDSETYEEQVAALEALENITTSEWTYFSAEFFKDEYRLLRIYSTATNGANRVMLDNILVTEPVRASIDIGDISFIPDIPLSTSETRARVRLVNPRMNPTDIKVYLEWSTNTNRWGWESWRESIPRPTRTDRGVIELFPSATDKFLFESVAAMPKFPVDTVVQYCARVSYSGTGVVGDRFSETQGDVQNGFKFVNPEWYEPVDLNKQFGTTNSPVAHFWVFSTPTNSVFFNEITPATTARYLDESAPLQFVEIIGPEGADIGGWKLEIHDRDQAQYLPLIDSVLWTNEVPAGSTFVADASAAGGKGWGFWVFGAYGVPERNQELFSDEIVESVANGTSVPEGLYWTITKPGALVLKRSMGAYVDRVCWAAREQSEVYDFVNAGYRYLGDSRATRYRDAFAWVDTDDEENPLEWDVLSSFSPGAYNRGQEETIWNAPDASGPVEPATPPELADLKIVAIEMDAESGRMFLTCTARVTNGVAIAEGDFSWYVEARDSLGGSVEDVDVTDQGPVLDAGTEDFEVTFEFEIDPSAEAGFYRVKAVPSNP
ncbi:MAG: hypothetical protein IJ783_06035 [Kiritimatiellae bacterium]|nr:hypothetical protein [Kiritimatiellia bacterium]